jgi:hypothetical protein
MMHPERKVRAARSVLLMMYAIHMRFELVARTNKHAKRKQNRY